MKKTLLKLAIVTSLIIFSAAKAGAANTNGRNDFRTGTAAPATDTPYIASLKIYRTGVRDTPYLSITTSSSTVYDEAEQVLFGERGTFKISISFYSETGMLIRNEIYFLRKGDEDSPRRQ